MKRHNVIVVLLVGIFFLGNLNLVQAKNKEEKIYKNIYIKNIDVSNLTKVEAKNKLEEVINKNNQFNLNLADRVYNLKLNEIGVYYKIDESIKKAYSVGRSEDVLSNIKTRMNLKMGKSCKVDLNYAYDNNKLENYISYIKQEINKTPIDATIKVENNLLKYEKESYGIEIDEYKLKGIIISKIEAIYSTENEIPINHLNPQYLYSDVVKIDTILGSYETHFNAKLQNRVNNIRVAAKATNDVIVNKSQEFSFNKYVNDNTIISEFKKAPVIVNGKLKDGLGGGICQVSSTIYNASLYSGLQITKVKNHSIPSAYVSKGRDATVSTGDVDFRFKNNFNSPILIHNEIKGNRIISTIYGNKEDKKNIEVTTYITKKMPNKVKVKNSNKLYVGESKVFQKGRVGYKVNTFRIYNGEGDKIKEFINESYYPPLDEIIIHGTKERGIKNNMDTQVI
ncbi:MAG: VanW family protein [Romboutsia sp.]